MDRVLVFASHGKLAEGLVDSATMILGRISDPYRIYSLQPGNSTEDFARQMEENIRKQPTTEYVILTDLYGASVFQALYSLVKYSNVTLFTGMNLNLVLAVCLQSADSLEVCRLVEESRAGIQCVEVNVQEREEDF